ASPNKPCGLWIRQFLLLNIRRRLTMGHMTTHTPVRMACEADGGVSALARNLGVKPPTVSQCAKSERPVPVERCFAIERATKGLITRRDLRPDDWHEIWPELKRRQRG